MIWSYGLKGMDDAYFYWDWCPVGDDDDEIKWRIVRWIESQVNLDRYQDRIFKFKEFNGYTNSDDGDEMPVEYDALDDEHTGEQ